MTFRARPVMGSRASIRSRVPWASVNHWLLA